MTLGVGRGMDLNFDTLATLLRAAQAGSGFAVRPLVEATGYHENKVKGHQSWARAMGLVHGTDLTPLAHYLLQHDPSLGHPISRGVGYIELAANSDAEVAYHICNVLLPRLVANDAETSTEEVVAMLIGDGVASGSKATGQPRRDANLFLRSLRSERAFGVLGIVRQTKPGQYRSGPVQLGPELTGYALLRRWPDGTPHLRMADVHRLLAPLLLPPTRLVDDLAVLERRGLVVRITSSGLDQVRPVTGRHPEEALWPSLPSI